MPLDNPPTLRRYLQGLAGSAPEPWQLDFMRSARFAGRPSIETYRRLHEALKTVVPAAECAPSAGSTRARL